jgi:curved DNA-binding protein
MTDPHTILGVKKDATPEELKKAYRKMSKVHHPDKGGNEEKFKEVTDAYDKLTNPKRKTTEPPSGFGGDFNYDDIEHIFQHFRGEGGGHGFRDAFNARYGRDSGKGRDVTARVMIPIEDAFSGTEQKMNVGLKTVEFKIPPGVRNGQKLRVKGYGQNGSTPEKNGDLIIEVYIAQHEFFQLDNVGLHTIQSVDVLDAILGTEATIKVFGKSIKFTVPEGTQNGATLRLRGKGWPVLNNPSELGDLYIGVILQTPTDLTEDEKTAIRKIKTHINGRGGKEKSK